MKKQVLLIAAFTATAGLSFGQTKTKVKNDEVKIKSADSKTKTEAGITKIKDENGKREIAAVPKGFQVTPNGLVYRIITDAPGDLHPKLGDQVEMHINTHIGDSSLFNSRKLNNNQPVPFQIAAPAFKGDLVEGFMMMTPGDSAVFRVSVDSLKKAGAQLMPWMKEGDMIDYEVTLVSVKSQDQLKKEAEEKAARQVSVDDSLLQDYFKKNNIKPEKTASGLYYTIAIPGSGETAKVGEQVTVNYTGKTLDGNVFDSNIDPKFQHVQPFQFILGQGHVIKGWDEGLTYFKKGTQGTLYIPSGLAYGERSPSPAIPASAVLIFDINVLNAEALPIRVEKGAPANDKAEDRDHQH
jgi:FKBP-type peptidyl-prolyl cis-trans isomerase